jgi:phenylacetic acid degradation operon negative regulatory protein
VSDQLRRRAVGSRAARSALLTVLGEYVLPLDGGVWQETLTRALVGLGYGAHAGRQAVARSVAAGWLTSERRGRRSRLSLSEPTAAMLRSGAERIYRFGEPREWDGRWLLVVVRVPEQRREVRHRLRTRLAWAGFGSLGGGLWVSPHVEREHEVSDVASDGSAAELLSFRAVLGPVGDPAKVAAAAWDLEAVAEAYRAFVSRFGRARPRGREAIFRAQTELVHEWRRFPFIDPDLPDGLLARSWPRDRARELFVRRHAEWSGPAQEHFRSLNAVERSEAGQRRRPQTAAEGRRA